MTTTMRVFIALLVIGIVATGIFIFAQPKGGEPDGSGEGDRSQLIQVASPRPNALVKSPMTISGKARGYWYFEASFPAQLLDANGAILYEGSIQADGEWMTEEFVPFNQEITFIAPTTETGILVLKKDNPSGLPENDDELRIPVRFDPATATSTEFGTAVIFSVGERVVFPDTLAVTLKEIDDSRCKPDVQCVWAGELSALLIVGRAQSEVRLGTTNNRSVDFGNYNFTLVSANEKTATVIVKKIAAAKTGEVRGYVHIGPTCPVVRAGEEDECADRPYATSIEVHYADERLYSVIKSGADGRFLVMLPAGEYILRPQAGNVMPSCAEERIAVAAGAVVHVDIGCDSGIR